MYARRENASNIQSSDDRLDEVVTQIPSAFEQKLLPATEDDVLEDVSLDSSVLEQSKGNGLEDLYDYFIKEKYGDPIPFNKGSKIGLFLELLGGTGGVYAWPPAWEFAKNYAPWISYSFAISNPISNSLFLIKATDDLIETIQAEASVPKEIAELINSPTKKNLLAKYTKMSLGSLVCVVPFSIAVYLFPLPNCSSAWCLGLTVAHSTLSNTILHGISWGLILTPKYWYYRLPVLPFEKLYSFIKTRFSTPEELEQLRLMNEQQVVQAKYKDQLVYTLMSTAQKIVKQHLSKEDFSLRAIQEDKASLIDFVELAKSTTPALPAAPDQQSYFYSMVNKVHGFLSGGGISVLGAGIMIAGCIGWIANPIYIGFLEELNLAESIGIGSLPVYSTAVLCAFYGTGIFNQIYNYFTTWTGSIRDKLSPEIQMYPKTFALFALANIYISFFAFATGTQLIRTIFADEMWDDIRPTLEGISIPTLQILSFIPLMELFNLVVRKSLAKFGSLENDDTLATRLLVKVPVIIHYLQQMKGDELMRSISKYSSQQQRALGIDPEQFQTDFQTFFQLKKQIEQLRIEPTLDDVENPRALTRASSNRNSFFSSKTMSDATPLLAQEIPKYN